MSVVFDQKTLTPAVTLTTVSTAIISTGCEVAALVFCNKDTAQRTVTVVDANSKALVSGLTIDPGKTQQVAFDPPQFMDGAVKWSASANSAIDAHIMANTARNV